MKTPGKGLKITCVMGPFLPVPPVWGGAVERIFLALCVEFAKAGHDVTIISRQFDAFPKEETRDGVRHLRLKSRDAPKNKLAYRLLDLAYAARVIRALPKSDITITHSVSLPIILPKKRAGKIVVSVGRFPKGQMSMYRRADRLQAVSSHVANIIRQQSPSVANLVKALPNCISQEFTNAISHDCSNRERRILFVGRIAREKGIDILIRAFARLKQGGTDWKLKIVGPHQVEQGGDGIDYIKELKSLAGDYQSDVEFVDPVYDQGELIEIFKRSAIFVYPSIADRGESFGLAPLEAMACGCSVIVSKLDCFDDYLRDGENGIKFDHATQAHDNLYQALRSLIENDDLRERIRRNGILTAESYSPANVAKIFLKDFKFLHSS